MLPLDANNPLCQGAWFAIRQEFHAISLNQFSIDFPLGSSATLTLEDYGRVARDSPATDSGSTRESCILGIVIELLRIDRGGWVALFPGNCSTYGFVDIH